ncbi:hypothetical protein HPB50_017752 [Hyalomma asiaticum]|uniref:Uncharacterized protein n=1 Tax=Hyalomma asiaticum TaxID=266040 RepID=A0ACB7SW01_HYAAI|nr:hypothetical protein HPB50_017752 [Hyalomma asiaticum]
MWNVPFSTHDSRDLLLLVHVALRVAKIGRPKNDSPTIPVELGLLQLGSLDGPKAKRTVRRSQNTKLLQEARTLLNDTNTGNAKLKGIFHRLTSNNLELSSIDAAVEEHIPVDELEAGYSIAAEYNDQAIGMLAELRCQVAALERTESKRQ